MENQMLNNPIRISDAASLLRREISDNERPYIKAVLKHNNALVDEWYNKVLKQIADNKGCVKSGQVTTEWHYFYDGKTITKFIEHLELGLVSRPSPQLLEFWKSTFEKSSVKELMELGVPLVGHGWKIILDEMFISTQLDKWEKVYKGSNDPLIWRKNANDHAILWSINNQYSFWSQEQTSKIAEKIMSVVKTPVKVAD